MIVFPFVNGDPILVCLVGDTESNERTKQDLVALHVVRHSIFKCWSESISIDDVEVNSFVGDNLDSNVTLRVLKEAK